MKLDKYFIFFKIIFIFVLYSWVSKLIDTTWCVKEQIRKSIGSILSPLLTKTFSKVVFVYLLECIEDF